MPSHQIMMPAEPWSKILESAMHPSSCLDFFGLEIWLKGRPRKIQKGLRCHP
jgi:hypothetical protein